MLFRLVFLVGNVRNRADEKGNVWFFYKNSTKHAEYFACLVFENEVDETGYDIYKNTNISTQTLYNFSPIETRQPFSPAQKYFNKPECKNLCKEFVLYNKYILLHIATIHTSSYREVF